MSLHDQIECDCVRNNRTSVRAGDQSLACRTVSTASAPIGRGRNISDSGFGQVDPRRPILRAAHDDQHRKRRLLIAFALAPDARNRCDRRSFQREAMLGLRMSLASEFEKCACGDEAPIAFVERRPSDRKLNTGPPRGRDGAKLKFIGTSSFRCRRRASPDPCRFRLRQVEFGLLHRDAELQRLHQYSAQRMYCS